MRDWRELGREESALFNPAFTALAIRRSVLGYVKECSMPMPLPLVFVSVTSAVNNSIRARLPRAVTTSLHVWVNDNRDILPLFGLRLSGFSEFCKRGIVFGSRYRVISLNDSRVELGSRAMRDTRISNVSTPEMNDVLRRSEWLGKWFARSGDVKTILSAWGIRS